MRGAMAPTKLVWHADHFMSTQQAAYGLGLKPQDVADANRVFEGSSNRTELIAAKARMVSCLQTNSEALHLRDVLLTCGSFVLLQRAAGVDPWEPTQIQRAAVPAIQRTVKWNAPPSIPVEGLSDRSDRAYTSVSTGAAVTSAVNQTLAGTQASSFARHGQFTKSFKSMNGEGCVTNPR